ncbi:Hpt domain-containing protein [Nisaea sp.]|uniref:Hpt domain-containing protein n=1 Tax=Nisaea sp. TaxID=2024842 RepID=UPI003B51F86A
MSDSSMRETFIRLRGEFLEICKGRFDVLRRQMDVLEGEPSEEERIAALGLMGREAHTIAGSSGTYGYSDVSRCARALEHACAQGLSAEEDRNPEAQLSELSNVYRGLLSEADRMFANPDMGTVPF